MPSVSIVSERLLGLDRVVRSAWHPYGTFADIRRRSTLLDPVLARSLLRRPLPLPSPKPFYYPTLHSLGVIGKGERVETLRPRNQGVTTSPRRPIVLHGSSFNSFLWKRPPGEAPIVLHGNGQGWFTG